MESEKVTVNTDNYATILYSLIYSLNNNNMKTRKNFLWLFVIFAVIVSSCKKDENPTPELIVNQPGALYSSAESATEIMNGLKLTLTYNQASGNFIGTMENINTNVVPQAMVEVYVTNDNSSSTTFGPTTPIDMQPGEIINVVVPADQSVAFTGYKIHPAPVKASDEGGEGSEGGEGGNEGGGEGGGEGGDESGTLWDKIQTADEIVNGVRLILDFDTITESFTGKLENLNTVNTNQVRVEVHVYQSETSSIEFGPTTPGDMAPSATRNVTLPITHGTSFLKFNMHPEVGGYGI